MTKKIRHFLIRWAEYAWGIFLNGLFAILPITLTIALFGFSLRLLKSWLEPIQRMEPEYLQKIPYSEIALVIVVIFLIGIILRFFILRSLIHWIEALISRIPLVRPIYAGIKQLVHAFSMQDKISFQSVVLVEFPRPGLYSLGFMTSEMSHVIAPESGQKWFNVFIPTTPNPTSGYFVMVPEKDIIPIELTRQEAMALIISGGIIQPERFVKKN
jgi:uncharacterized membrane protein